MRLDKFLKVSRLIKRRTVANEACDAGRVLVNGRPAKASAKGSVGSPSGIARSRFVFWRYRIRRRRKRPRSSLSTSDLPNPARAPIIVVFRELNLRAVSRGSDQERNS